MKYRQLDYIELILMIWLFISKMLIKNEKSSFIFISPFKALALNKWIIKFILKGLYVQLWLEKIILCVCFLNKIYKKEINLFSLIWDIFCWRIIFFKSHLRKIHTKRLPIIFNLFYFFYILLNYLENGSNIFGIFYLTQNMQI